MFHKVKILPKKMWLKAKILLIFSRSFNSRDEDDELENLPYYTLTAGLSCADEWSGWDEHYQLSTLQKES